MPQPHPSPSLQSTRRPTRPPPFKGSPTLIWTTEIGRVLTAVLDGGAKVAGFDVVLANSIEQSELPFGDDAVGAKLRGFDRPFLRSLAAGAASGKVVLGEALAGRRRQPADGRTAHRSSRLFQHSPAQHPVRSRRRGPARAADLCGQKTSRFPRWRWSWRRARSALEPDIAADGGVTLAGYRVPSSVKGTLTLNFDGGAADVRTYSLADLRACVEKDDKEFFQRQFADKIVIFGTLLDAEDRKLTSKRFATGIEESAAPRCALPPAKAGTRYARSTIAGVYIHATAVNNLLAHDGLIEFARNPTIAMAVGFALLTALAAWMLAPAAAAATYLGLVVLTALGATYAFSKAYVIPLSEPFIAGFLALLLMIAWRLVVTDRGQRLLRRSFALYLAPQVIDRMLASNKLPDLGGETRDVTVFFSDLEGFSSIAEKMSPTELVAFVNEYLSAMTDIIESKGGYVDKYIGDSIVAMFGAPVDDSDHARHAAEAALLCRAKLDELNKTSSAFRGLTVAHRMGLNSGEALVGNIGSRRRFNYSVMSDAVNVASRLEGANKFYGTTIIASETTAAQTGSTFAWRELDAVRVLGRETPVKIYELMALSWRGDAAAARGGGCL